MELLIAEPETKKNHNRTQLWTKKFSFFFAKFEREIGDQPSFFYRNEAFQFGYIFNFSF